MIEKGKREKFMNFTVLTEKWCNLSDDASVIIVTDSIQNSLAEEIAGDIKNNCRIICLDSNGNFMPELQKLRPCDLVVGIFAYESWGDACKFFSPFDKPDGVSAKYVFIRLSISKESLLQGLSTHKELIYNKISELHKLGNTIRITNAAGTDIILETNGFPEHENGLEIVNDGEMAFLPPSETGADPKPGKANGKIVVDVTIGGLDYYDEHLEDCRLANGELFMLTVENGMVTDITGGEMAAQYKEKLFALPPKCRELVELGHGLSKMTPTGNGGVDESIIDTCHFGIGNDWGGEGCGLHTDFIIGEPVISKLDVF